MADCTATDDWAERYQPWLVAVVAARLVVERLMTGPLRAAAAGTASVEVPLAAEAFGVLRDAVALLAAAPAVPVRDAESARRDALDALRRAAMVFAHPSRPPGPVRDLLARADRALLQLGDYVAPPFTPVGATVANTRLRADHSRGGARRGIVEFVGAADSGRAPDDSAGPAAWDHPAMAAQRFDPYASLKQHITRRVTEVGERIEQLRSRRAELAGGGGSTQRDVDKAAAAAGQSKQRADAAHLRAAEALEAAARVHEEAAARNAGDPSAHQRAAEVDREEAARHHDHAMGTD